MASPAASPSGPPAAYPDFATRDDMATNDWRPGEVFLLSALRTDIRGWTERNDCRPRRDDLPAGATDGVECPEKNDPVVDRVGAFLFPDDDLARAAYDERLSAYGMAPTDDGGCPFAGAGNAAIDAKATPVAACFVNEFGKANLRVFWPGASVVVGVLGKGGDVNALEAWARGVTGPAKGLINVWLGSLGAAGAFTPCPDVSKPSRISAPTSLVYEDGSIWLSDPAGTHRRKLVDSGGHSEWSPDGRQLAYVRGRDTKDAVRLLDVGTGHDRRVALVDKSTYSSEGTTAIHWSPDGRTIGVTAMWDEGGPDLGIASHAATWLVDPIKGTSRRLHDGVLLGWSPDSGQVLIGESEHEDWYANEETDVVDLVEVGSGDGVILGRGAAAAFAANCAFVSLASSPYAELVSTVVLDGVGTRPRLAALSVGSDWAPDAPELAIGIRGQGIWRVCLCDGEATRVGGGTSPTWSEDGSRLAVFRRAGLTIVDPDGSDPQLAARAAWPLGDVAWSPDGRFLATSAEETGDTCGPEPRGYVITSDGSGVRSLPSPYHYRWRPVEPPRPAGDIEGQKPPRPSEGCGG